jgi:hypothetical protein
MFVTSDYSVEARDALVSEFTKSIQANDELTHGEIIDACMEIIGSVLINIECPGCRKVTRATIKKKLPQILTDAMAQAASVHTGRTSLHKH